MEIEDREEDWWEIADLSVWQCWEVQKIDLWLNL